MKKIIALMLAVSLVLVSLTSCSSKDKNEGAGSLSGDEIVIGSILPLTGNVSQYGLNIKRGAEIAVAEINEKGGVLGKQVVLKSMDSMGDATEAVGAYEKLMRDGIVGLIGDATSAPTSALAEMTSTSGLPMIAPAATAFEGITDKSDSVFRACFTDPMQGSTMANFAKDTLSAKTAAVLFNSSSDYSTGTKDAFIKQFESNGGTIIDSISYSDSAIDFTSQLTKLAADAPDVLFVPDYYEKALQIGIDSEKVGLKTTFLGTDGWDGLLAIADDQYKPFFEGSYFCTHFSPDEPNEQAKAFLEKATADGGEEPNAFVALGYDTAKIMLQAIEEAGSTDSAAVVDAIKNINYDSLSGPLTFDANRDPKKYLVIMTIEDGEYKYFSTQDSQ